MEEKEALPVAAGRKWPGRSVMRRRPTVAAEYAEKHEKRREIQAQKALALRAELELKRGEVEDMMVKLKEAKTKREALTATIGPGRGPKRHRGSSRPFDEMDRMAEKIEGVDHQREAEEELLSEFGELESPTSPRGPSPGGVGGGPPQGVEEEDGRGVASFPKEEEPCSTPRPEREGPPCPFCPGAPPADPPEPAETTCTRSSSPQEDGQSPLLVRSQGRHVPCPEAGATSGSGISVSGRILLQIQSEKGLGLPVSRRLGER